MVDKLLEELNNTGLLTFSGDCFESSGIEQSIESPNLYSTLM